MCVFAKKINVYIRVCCEVRNDQKKILRDLKDQYLSRELLVVTFEALNEETAFWIVNIENIFTAGMRRGEMLLLQLAFLCVAFGMQCSGTR